MEKIILSNPRRSTMSITSNLSSINRAFFKLWHAMGVDLTDPRYKDRILSDPAIDTHRGIFIEMHPEVEGYAAAMAFNTIADKFFIRKADSAEVWQSPYTVQYRLFQAPRAIDRDWLPYIEVFSEDEIVDVSIENVTKTVKDIETLNYHPFRREVEKVINVPMRTYRSVSYQKFRFSKEFESAFRSYQLNDAEAKRYKKLQGIADQLNEIFGHSDIGRNLPALFEYDFKTQKVRPSHDYTLTMEKYFSR